MTCTWHGPLMSDCIMPASTPQPPQLCCPLGALLCEGLIQPLLKQAFSTARAKRDDSAYTIALIQEGVIASFYKTGATTLARLYHHVAKGIAAGGVHQVRFAHQYCSSMPWHSRYVYERSVHSCMSIQVVLCCQPRRKVQKQLACTACSCSRAS